MTRFFCKTLILLILIPLHINASEFWNNIGRTIKINDFQKIKIGATQKFDNNELYVFEYKTEFNIKGIALKYTVLEEKSNANWINEHRPSLAYTFKWKVNNITISNKNQGEYRVRKTKEDSVRYRNKTTLNYKVSKFVTFNLDPYISNEIFYDGLENNINRNRVNIGLNLKKNTIKMNLFYGVDYNKSSDSWGFERSVIGTTFSFF
ncbi:DUF2490 domain-containing protein [bacterium]|nr:DUF2490 domain-containing protein [bacterium]